MLKKHFMSLFLVMAMIMGISGSAFAASDTNNEWSVKYDETGCIYLENSITGEMVIRAVRLDHNGHPYDVDLALLVQELNASKNDEAQASNTPSIPNNFPHANIVVEKYEESSSRYVAGAKEQVSPNVEGGSEGALIIQLESVTISDSYTISLALTAEIKRNIQVGASFTWTSSATSATTFMGVFNVPPYRTGYVAFQPRLHETSGTYIKESINTDTGTITPVSRTPASARCPVKLSNGLADGTYMLVLI